MILPSLVVFLSSTGSDCCGSGWRCESGLILVPPGVVGTSSGKPIGMEECDVLALTLRRPSGSLRSEARSKTEPAWHVSIHLARAASLLERGVKRR